jgi:arsenate reductase
VEEHIEQHKDHKKDDRENQLEALLCPQLELVFARPLVAIICRDGDLTLTAGTEPGLRVHPEVVAVMQEVGIDLRNATPQKVTQELANDAALLVTMGCGDKCPYVLGLRRDDWPLNDPKGLGIEEVRRIRDYIKGRVKSLLKEEGCALGGLY